MIREVFLIVLLQLVCSLDDYTYSEIYGTSVIPHVMVKFVELPNFYEELTIKSQNSLNSPRDLKDSKKGLVCKRIFGFEKVIEPEEYEKTLKRDHETIFRELFKEEETKKTSFLHRMKIGRRYNYDNASRFRTFLVDGREREENTFACVLQNSDQTQFHTYFVSSEAYNVNDAPDGEEILGRFVFFDNQMYALAEELPAVVRGLGLGEEGKRKHMETRNRYKITEKWEDDPVCKLDSGRKYRLCMYVCAVQLPGCENKVRVEEPCVKRTHPWEGQSYEEWMLTCQIKNPTVEQEFYVSRNYRNNEVHVYKEGIRRLRFAFKLSRVPVVIHKEELIAKL